MAFIGTGPAGTNARGDRLSARAVLRTEGSILSALRADRGLRAALVALYVLVACLIGLAHQAPPLVVPGNIAAFASAPVLAGDLAAALATLCSGTARGKTRAVDHGCDACRITHAPGLAGAAVVLAELAPTTLRQAPDPVSPAPAGLVPVPHSARGPPSA